MCFFFLLKEMMHVFIQATVALEDKTTCISEVPSLIIKLNSKQLIGMINGKTLTISCGIDIRSYHFTPIKKSNV